MRICGIDPGFKGGLSLIDSETNETVCSPMPVIVTDGKTKLDVDGVIEWFRTNRPERVLLELVHAMPGQGVTSMFNFGKGYGEIIGVSHAMGAPPVYITPQKWKKHFNLGQDKNASLELVKTLFPDFDRLWKFKKNEGIAESVLIAKYGHDINAG